MTTATKSLHDQLAALQQRADQAHAKAREARENKTRYEAEIHELRARGDQADPDEMATLKAEIAARDRSRIHNEGDHADALRAAAAPYHAIDQELQRFKRNNLRGLIEEAIADVDAAIEDMAGGWQSISIGCARYRAAHERASALVAAVSGMDGQDLAADPRIHEWSTLAAQQATDADVMRPRLTDMGNWKVDHRGD